GNLLAVDPDDDRVVVGDGAAQRSDLFGYTGIQLEIGAEEERGNVRCSLAIDVLVQQRRRHKRADLLELAALRAETAGRALPRRVVAFSFGPLAHGGRRR